MASTTMRLTKRAVDAARPESQRYVLWDTELKGFGLRVEASGTKTFFLRYRPRNSGRNALKRFIKLGTYGPVTPENARDRAKTILGIVAGGGDPAGELKKARAAITVAELVDRYLEDEVAPKLKSGTVTLYTHYLRGLAIPEIGKIKAEAVRRSDITKLHLKLGRTRPVAANRVLAVLSALFSYAAKQAILPEGFNPTKGISKFREAGRERFLTSTELERLGAAIREAETIGIPWDYDETAPSSKHVPKGDRVTRISPFAAAAIRLLLFTGCRLREILDLRWTDVDVERGMLHLADSKTGRKSVVLNTAALSVIGQLPRVGEYVIYSGATDGPRSDLKRPWSLVTRRARLGNVRLHDLRHSFASIGVGAGHGLPIIGKLLGHAASSTTARYAHLDADPVRRASNSIAAAIEAALNGNAHLSSQSESATTTYAPPNAETK